MCSSHKTHSLQLTQAPAAGAGTGKTSMLVGRVVHLLSKGVRPRDHTLLCAGAAPQGCLADHCGPVLTPTCPAISHHHLRVPYTLSKIHTHSELLFGGRWTPG